MSDAKWQNNAVQFPRLLAEIMATQNLDLAVLSESMDLSIDEVNELFDRADATWEKAKEEGEVRITVDLNVFDEDGDKVDGTTSDLTLPQISDIIDHASQLILVRRQEGDVEAIMDELEDALEVADVI